MEVHERYSCRCEDNININTPEIAFETDTTNANHGSMAGFAVTLMRLRAKWQEISRPMYELPKGDHVRRLSSGFSDIIQYEYALYHYNSCNSLKTSIKFRIMTCYFLKYVTVALLFVPKLRDAK
jgi:hypothetical protein